MREALINEIAMYLQSIVPDQNLTDIKMHLTLILNEYEIAERETAVAIRDEDQNEYMIKKFIVAKMVEGKTDRTVDYYKSTVSMIVDRIGKNVVEITTDDLRGYMAVRKLRDHVSEVTIGNEMRCMSSFFTFLQNEELIMKNPCRAIQKMRPTKVKKKAFTEMDVERVRGACRTARESAMVEILLSTGCRVTELAEMKISDITGDSLVVHGKGKKDRIVYLNAKAQMAAQNYMQERVDDNEYLFPCGIWFGRGESRPKGQCSPDWYRNPKLVGSGRMDASSIETIVRNIGKRAGVTKCHPHRFRRTCATFALRRGMPIEQVSKMLGHEDISTTQIYLDLSEEDLHQAHKKYVI